VLGEGTTIGYGEPAVWAATIDNQKPEPWQDKEFPKQLREVIDGARPNLSTREAQALKELIADYQESLKQRAVTTGAQRKCTTGSILATPGLLASCPADSL
jgi:hypothetical protein